MSKISENAIHASAVNFGKIVLTNVRTMQKHESAYNEYVAAKASLESAKDMFLMATGLNLNDVIKIHKQSNTSTNKKGSDVTKNSYTITIKTVEEISSMLSTEETKQPADNKQEISIATKTDDEQ